MTKITTLTLDPADAAHIARRDHCRDDQCGGRAVRDIDRLIRWLAAGNGGYPGAVQWHSDMALARPLHHVWGGYGYPEWCRRRVRAIDRAQSRWWRDHARWLRGGCHPLGTPERARDDARRRECYARMDRRTSALRESVLRAAEERYGWDK